MMSISFPPNMLTAMMRRKSLQDEHHENLHRSLTSVDLMLYGVGCSVGAGLYCLVGIGAQIAGPAISLSFLICGTACVFTSLAYAEFAARIPITGSAYVYAYVAFGEYWAWLVGWFLTLGYGFTASVVARSWAEYVADFFSTLVGTSLPYLTKFPIVAHYTCSPLSIVIVAFCTWILVTGAKESSRFNNFMTVLNISVLLFVVVAGVGSETILWDNLTPYAPQGLDGVARGAGLVFFAFIGFDMVACLSEEVIAPEINMPIGIVGSLVISAMIYVCVSLAVIGMAPITLLGAETPITNALLANACCTHAQQLQEGAAQVCLESTCEPLLHKVLLYGGRVVSFGAIFGLTTGTFTSLMGQPRIFYRMAQDGLLFDVFGKVDPVTRVPKGATVITGVLASFLACFIPLESLANMISLGTLMVFTWVDAGVIILRTMESHSSSSAVTSSTVVENGHKTSLLLGSSPVSADGGAGVLLTWAQEWIVYLRGNNVSDNGFKPVGLTLLFTLASLFASTTFGWRSILFGTIAVLSALALCILPQSPPPDTFSCPLVPLVPLIGIACNAVMMGSLPMSSWMFTLAWFVVGNLVYFAYGIHHSKLQKGHLVRMLSLPEATPLTNGQQEHAYESTGLERRAHNI